MSLSAKSKANLAEAHPFLQKLVNQFVLDYPDFPIQVNDARRGKAEQEAAYIKGNSKAHFGQSAHNYTPAIAVDVFPLPVNFSKLAPFKAMGAKMLATAKKLNIPIRWLGPVMGDYPHFELSPIKSWMAKAKLYLGNK